MKKNEYEIYTKEEIQSEKEISEELKKFEEELKKNEAQEEDEF